MYVLLTDQVCLWILRRRALATWATWRLQRCSNAAYAVTATSACQRWWLWTTVTCNLPVDAHPTGGGVARARTGAPHQSGSERARYASPAQNRRRPGFPVEGGRARASLGAALGAGRPWSDLVTNHVVRTVSKVLCLRSLRTSRCCWAYTSFQTASRLFRLTQTRISRCLAKVAAARAAPLVLSRPPQLRRVPVPALSHSSTSPRLYVHARRARRA